MIPIDFEGSNITMTKPNDMTDEQCGALRAMIGKTDSGYPYYIEAWQPNKEDIDAIVEGRPIFIQILSPSLPPIAMWTNNKEGEPNC